MDSLASRLQSLNPETRRYTLDTLASHLKMAGQYQRLHDLFGSDAWLHARHQGSAFTYDDYVRDLELAWEQVISSANIQVANQPAGYSSIRYSFRYGLIRTTLNSLAETYPPKIIFRAIELGYWPSERALSLAGQMPSPENRTELFQMLLQSNILSSAQITPVQKAALTAIQFIKEPKDAAERLAALAPLLATWQIAEAVDIALNFIKNYKAIPLAALISYATEDKRSFLIDLVLKHLQDLPEYDSAQAYGLVAPYLESGQLNDVLIKVKALSPQYGAIALSQLAKGAKEERKEQLYSKALQLAKGIKDDKTRVFALSKMIACFKDPLRFEVAKLTFETALRTEPIDQEYDTPQITGLQAAIPYLNKEILEVVLPAVKKLPEIPIINAAVIKTKLMLAMRMDADQRQMLMRDSLDRQKNTREKGSVEILLMLSSVDDGEQSKKFLQYALNNALNLDIRKGPSNQERRPKGMALSMLAPHLTTAQLQQLFTAQKNIPDHFEKSKALVNLAINLQGTARDKVLALAIKESGGIEEESQRQKVLVSLAPALPDSLLRSWLDMTLTIKFELSRGDTLAAMAKICPPTFIQELYDCINAIGFEPSKSKAFFNLVPLLPMGMLGDALAKARKITWEPGRTEVICAIAGRLPEGQRKDICQSMIDSYTKKKDGISDSNRLIAIAQIVDEKKAAQVFNHAFELESDLYFSQVIVALKKHINDEWLESIIESLPALSMYADDILEAIRTKLSEKQILRVIELVLLYDFPLGKAKALGMLAPVLKGDLLESTIQSLHTFRDKMAVVIGLEMFLPYLTKEQISYALKVAKKISKREYKVWALAVIIPVVQGKSRTDAIKTAFRAALAIPASDKFRIKSFERILPFLEGEYKVKAGAEVMATAFQAGKLSTGAYLLAAVVPFLEGEDLVNAIEALLASDKTEFGKDVNISIPLQNDNAKDTIQKLMVTYPYKIRRDDRTKLFRLLQEKGIVNRVTVSQNELEQFSEDIVEICSEWKWL